MTELNKCSIASIGNGSTTVTEVSRGRLPRTVIWSDQLAGNTSASRHSCQLSRGVWHAHLSASLGAKPT